MITYKVQPWAHQLQAINDAKDKTHYALFMEMGAGKTLTAINILRHKWLNDNFSSTIVFCPPIVIENWRREFHAYSEYGSQVTLLTGPGKKRAETFKKEAFGTNAKKKARIFVTNYETLLMSDVMALFIKWAPTNLVFDESHLLKNMAAKRTKCAITLAEKAKFKMILTGSPILNDAMDIFAQWRVLDGGELFGKNFYGFRARYFVDKNAYAPNTVNFPDWSPKPGALEKINELIKPHSVVVKKKDCMDLPPFIRQEVRVDLGIEQRRAYEAMRRDFVAYMKEGTAVATLAITKVLRMMQIISGHVVVEGVEGEKAVVAFDQNPRVSALKDLLEQICPANKVIVWACFKHNYPAIRAAVNSLGLDSVEVHGETPEKDRMAAVDRFQNDPGCSVFIGNAKACGTGVNLTAAPYSIYFSRSLSLGDDIQSEARNYRGGSDIHEKVTRIDIIAQNTIDEEITKRLASKVEIGDAVLKQIALEM